MRREGRRIGFEQTVEEILAAMAADGKLADEKRCGGAPALRSSNRPPQRPGAVARRQAGLGAGPGSRPGAPAAGAL
jgi:hypothetical protein